MMRRPIAYLSALAVAGLLAFAMAGSAEATPAAGALPNMSLPGSDVTPTHCRRYYHCHRRCWRGRWGWRCRRWCHRC
jgi:hypothetical protein